MLRNLSSDEKIWLMARAKEKYALCSDSEIAIVLTREMDKDMYSVVKRSSRLLIKIATTREAAKNEGREQGKKEGKEEGLIEGEKKGAQQKMKELAQNMRLQGFQDTVIAKCLNISIEELHKIFDL